MIYQLSDYFAGDALWRNGRFATLGSGRNEWPGTLAYADTATYLRRLTSQPNISAVLTREDLAREFGEEMPEGWGVAVAGEPRDAFFELHEKFLRTGGYGEKKAGMRGEGCRVAASAQIAEGAILGDGVEVGERVVICDGVEVGTGCVLEPGVVLGAEGILYRRTEGRVSFVRQAGRVVLGAGVVCLAQSVVVRSVHPGYPTRVGDRSVVGIGATVGHEAQVGEDCVISGQSIVARGSVLEAGSFVGPGAVVTENLRVGRGGRVLTGSVVIRDVEAGAEVSGNFARSHMARLAEFVRGGAKK